MKLSETSPLQATILKCLRREDLHNEIQYMTIVKFPQQRIANFEILWIASSEDVHASIGSASTYDAWPSTQKLELDTRVFAITDPLICLPCVN